jgi:hypothetical protein
VVRLAIEAWEILHDEGLDATAAPNQARHARRPRALPFARGKTG